MHYSEIAGLCEVLPKTVHTYLADWTNPTYADPRFGGIRRDGDGYYTFVGASHADGCVRSDGHGSVA